MLSLSYVNGSYIEADSSITTSRLTRTFGVEGLKHDGKFQKKLHDMDIVLHIFGNFIQPHIFGLWCVYRPKLCPKNPLWGRVSWIYFWRLNMQFNDKSIWFGLMLGIPILYPVQPSKGKLSRTLHHDSQQLVSLTLMWPLWNIIDGPTAKNTEGLPTQSKSTTLQSKSSWNPRDKIREFQASKKRERLQISYVFAYSIRNCNKSRGCDTKFEWRMKSHSVWLD